MHVHIQLFAVLLILPIKMGSPLYYTTKLFPCFVKHVRMINIYVVRIAYVSLCTYWLYNMLPLCGGSFADRSQYDAAVLIERDMILLLMVQMNAILNDSFAVNSIGIISPVHNWNPLVQQLYANNS